MSLPGFNYSKAYLIGIDKYAHPIPELRTPVNDIKRIAENLADFDEVEIIQNITREDFIDFLAKLSEEEHKPDRVLFYFAGHGSTDNTQNRPEGNIIFKNKAGEENSGDYKIEDLLINLNKLTSKHLLLVLDCCFAGSVQWDITKRPAGRFKKEEVTNPLYKVYTGNNAWQIITSTGSNQEAMDFAPLVKKVWEDGIRDEINPNSPFAQQFINALQGNEAGTYFKNNIITTGRLYTYIYEKLAVRLSADEIKYDQQPGLFTLLKHKNGQFIFTIKGKEISFADTPDFTNPYKGFEPYSENDGDIFFGRDTIIAAFKDDKTTNFLISGEAGIGKSSVVKAGFIPLVKHEKNKPIIVQPGTFDLNAFTVLKNNWDQNSADNRILFFDQFEEFLTLPDDKKSEIKKIIKVAAEAGDVYLFVAIRSIKLKNIREIEEFGWGSFKEIVIPFPSSTDIEDIITNPAKRHATIINALDNENITPQNFNISKDENFINKIEETYNRPGSLPFLSMALQEWFKKSVSQYVEPRLLKQSIWELPTFTQEVLSNKMNLIITKINDENAFQRLMFRLVAYDDNIPYRHQLSLEYTKGQEQEMIDLLENERIIRFVDHTKKIIEFSHISIIEKWLLHQDWFKKRHKKARGSIARLINVQNALIPAVYKWELTKARKDLWNRKEDLPKLKRDIEEAPVKESYWEHIKSTFCWPSRIIEARSTYFIRTELDFIQQSERRRKIGEKFFYRVGLGITIILITAIAIILLKNKMLKIEVDKNLAYFYAEQSLNRGETEALLLLKEANSLSQGHKLIRNKIDSVFYRKNYVGDPFAIATLEDTISEYTEGRFDPLTNLIVLYNKYGDHIVWDYTRNIKKNATNPETSIFFKKRIIETTLKVDRILDSKISESKDSIFFICEKDTNYLFYIYCLNKKGTAYVYNFPKDKALNNDEYEFTFTENYKLSFSPQKKYLLYSRKDSVFIYTLSHRLVYAFKPGGAINPKYHLTAAEDKIFFYTNISHNDKKINSFDLMNRQLTELKIKPLPFTAFHLTEKNDIILKLNPKTKGKFYSPIFLMYDLEGNLKDTIAIYQKKTLRSNIMHAKINYYKGAFFIYKAMSDTIYFPNNKAFLIAPSQIIRFTENPSYIYSVSQNYTNNLFYTKIYSINDKFQLILEFSNSAKPNLVKPIKNDTQLLVGFENNTFFIYNLNRPGNLIPAYHYINIENENTQLGGISIVYNTSKIIYKSNGASYPPFNFEGTISKIEVDTIHKVISGMYVEKNKNSRKQFVEVFFYWDIERGQRKTFRNEEGHSISTYAFSPFDEYFLFIAAASPNIEFYNLNTEKKDYSLPLSDPDTVDINFLEDKYRFYVIDHKNEKKYLKYLPYKLEEVIRTKKVTGFSYLLNPVK